MTGDSSKFTQLTKFDGENVHFESNHKRKVIGRGTVQIGSLTIHDVSCVKGLKDN